MESKDIIALGLLVFAACAGILLTCLSTRIRDVFFFLLVTLSAVTEFIDVNFVSRDWYRGSTRGFEVSLVDVIALSVLVSSVLVPRRGEKRLFWPASLGLMIVYFGFAAFCVSIADPKLFGFFELSKMLRGIVVFLAAAMYIRTERELKILAGALGLIVSCEALCGFVQRYAYGEFRVYGTVDDSNSLSMYFCLTAPVLLAVITARFPRYLKALAVTAIALAFVGTILTISRAGVVTISCMLFAAALVTVSFRITTKKVAIALTVLVCAAGVTAKAWKTLSARFKESTLKQEYEDKRSMGRGYYIRIAATIADDRWFGVGLNNWSYWVSNKYGPKLGWHFVPYYNTDRAPSDIVPSGVKLDAAQAAPAHSLAALTTGELGYGGLFLFTLLWLRWFQMGIGFLWRRTPDPMRRMSVGIFFGTCGIFFQSMTEWVFRQTPIFFTFNILIGTLASLYYFKRKPQMLPTAEPELSESDPALLTPAHAVD